MDCLNYLVGHALDLNKKKKLKKSYIFYCLNCHQFL